MSYSPLIYHNILKVSNCQEKFFWGEIMGTNKPRIQAIVEQEYYEKFSYLCKRDKRSESNFASMIIEKYIDEYEKIHGEIKVE